MRKRPQSSPPQPKPSAGESSDSAAADSRNKVPNDVRIKSARRSGFVWLTLFTMIVYSTWAIYRYQFESLPVPLTAEQAGKRGFSEVEAVKHVKALTEFGPHSVGSDALDLAMQYVLEVANSIKKTAHWEVDVEVEFFHANSSANRLNGGIFKGKTLVYSDLKHVVLRILPKYVSSAEDNAILVSSHIDTVFSGVGAADCSSCVAVMLELARGISQWAHGFKNSVIFLFNTGEEEGLNGAHSFITQHPLRDTIRTAIDLEAMGIGGRSMLFQAGPDPWAIENYASVVKHPTASILAQDLFSFGVIKSATDFQVYKDVAGLSGLDFAYTDNTAVYHTKNDKLELLKSGSLQHLGENMLAFLLHIGPSPQLSKLNAKSQDDPAVFFDIMGTYLIVYRQKLSKMIHSSIILQSLLIWITSIFMGGFPAAVSLALSCLSILLTWIFSLSFSALVAFILPLISTSPVPFIASPLLAIGLFAAPAFLGALIGQHLGFRFLQKYLSSVYSTRKLPSPALQADLVKSEAERWLFKSGSLQWLVLLSIGTYYKIGSTYMALVWLVPPTFAYGMLEATLTPVRLPRPLKLATLLIGLALPILFSAGVFIRFAGLLIGMAVRFDRNPGGTSEWLGSLVVAVYVAAVICLTLTYILSYVHISGAKSSIILATCILFGLSLAAVLSGVFPAFTEDTSRAVNVVHVVDSTGGSGEKPDSFISFSSLTPGKLTKEVEQIQEGFVCSRDKTIDLVTFTVKYGCLSFDETEDGWSESDIPTLNVVSDTVEEKRITEVSVDTKSSTRWVLAINTDEIEDFTFKGEAEELVSLGNKTSIDNWHTIQFSGGKNSPTKFELSLVWIKNHTKQQQTENARPLLKLRTDVDRVTPKTERVLSKLPPWCSLFGKSTSPYTLAFLSNLPVVF